MDWTAEVVVGVKCITSSNGYIFTIGNITGFNTLSVYVTSADLLRAVIVNQTTTQYVTIQSLSTSMAQQCANAFVLHITYHYSSRIMRFYLNGDLKTSVTLSDDLGTITSHISLGDFDDTTGPDGSTYYRTTLTARVLDRRQIRKRVKEYRARPLIVFSKDHIFKGYPMLDNGLLNVRSVADTGTLEFGERAHYEMYDDGTYVRAEGDVSSVTEPLEIAHRITDDREAVCIARIWDTPILKSVNQDEIWIELRQQLRNTDAYTDSEGFHVTNRIGMSTGLFTLDIYSIISTRAQNWEIYFRHSDMQACWREGGWMWQGKTVLNADVVNMRGNFYAAAGTGATGYTMDGDASPDHFMNHSIFMNLNYDGSTWSSRNYLLGIMGEHQKDYLYVPIAGGDDVIETFHFDDLQKEVGGEFRFAMCLTPHDVGKHYSDEQGWAIPQGWAKLTTGSDAVRLPALNDNLLNSLGDSSVAYAWINISYDPGSYKLFSNMFRAVGSAVHLHHRLWVYTDLTPDDIRTSTTWFGDNIPNVQEQNWWDTDLTINDDTVKTLRTEVVLAAESNTGYTVYFDGIAIMPMYNGADFPLDQLYSARNLKQIKRRNK